SSNNQNGQQKAESRRCRIDVQEFHVYKNDQRHQRSAGQGSQRCLNRRPHALIVADAGAYAPRRVVPKTPEQWLEQASPEKKTGTFKLFLGYAPGVGKTYNMLSEAIRRSKRGEDVVIGVAETHGRKGVAGLIGQLPAVTRRRLEYKGTVFEEMDVDAIIAR